MNQQGIWSVWSRGGLRPVASLIGSERPLIVHVWSIIPSGLEVVGSNVQFFVPCSSCYTFSAEGTR